MNKGDNSLWLFSKCQVQMFSFRSTLIECTVRIHDKRYFTLQRHWKNQFVSYEKNKKHNTKKQCA